MMQQCSTRACASGAVNVGDWERWASAMGGLCLAACGFSSRGPKQVILPILGGMLVYRGLTGHCDMYAMFGVDTTGRGEATAVPAGHGFKVQRTVHINREPAEVFRAWRRFDQLPRFMSHLSEVRELGGNRSHWVAKAPLGVQVSWDAEVINERPNELIAWRSLPGSMVETAGSVHFERSGRGTDVHVSLKYNPPAGQTGATLARWLGESPEVQLQEDLQRFKRNLEGERAAVMAAG